MKSVSLENIGKRPRLLWCCTVSACAREKKQFPLSVMDFADNIDQGHLKAWQRAIQKRRLGWD